LERSATDVLLHDGKAACAASKADSTSAAVERAAWQRTLPSMGEMLSKYLPKSSRL
jgi:hypothetical protein